MKENEESFPSRRREPVTTGQFHELVKFAAYDRWVNQGSPIPGDEKGDWAAAEIEVLKGFYAAQESEDVPPLPQTPTTE